MSELSQVSLKVSQEARS